jgi:hypothetical protein
MILGDDNVPLIAYSVSKLLSFSCPNGQQQNDVERSILWLLKGTATSPSSVVAIDSSAATVGCAPYGDVGYRVALARSLDGRVHAAYIAFPGSYLKYAVSNVGVASFTSVVVGNAGMQIYAREVSLAIDAQGYPHIAYISDSHTVRYTYQNASGWHSVEAAVPAGSVNPKDVALVLDQSGLAYVVLSLGSELWCERETAAGTFVTHSRVDAGTTEIFGVSVVIMPDGTLHASYVRDNDIRYAIYTQGAWYRQLAVDLGPGQTPDNNQTSLCIGSNGSPWIGYKAPAPAGGTGVFLAKRTGSVWSSILALPCDEGGGGSGGGGGGGDHDPFWDYEWSRHRERGGPTVLGRLMLWVLPEAGGQRRIAFRLPWEPRGSVRLGVFDLLGRKWGQGEIPSGFGRGPGYIQLGRVPSGVYLVRAESSSGQYCVGRTVLVR